MKKREGKWEACVDKSTVPEGGLPSYLELDTWYPVDEFDSHDCMWLDSGDKSIGIYTSIKNSCHLGRTGNRIGGNFKLRKVKDV